MSQDPRASQFSPPWFLIIGLVAGGAFLVFMLADSSQSGKRHAAHSKHVVELTAENWQKEVVESGIPVLVDFWASWCKPCIQLSPTIDSLADRYAGKVKVGKVNVDEQKKIAARYDIEGLPCVMIFDRSERPSQVIAGRRDEDVYVREIEGVLARK